MPPDDEGEAAAPEPVPAEPAMFAKPGMWNPAVGADPVPEEPAAGLLGALEELKDKSPSLMRFFSLSLLFSLSFLEDSPDDFDGVREEVGDRGAGEVEM